MDGRFVVYRVHFEIRLYPLKCSRQDMHFLRHTVLVAAITLAGSASAVIDAKMPNTVSSTPSLRANSLVVISNRKIATRSLRHKSKTLDGDDYASNLENRGYLTNWLGYKIDLKTISDGDLTKILNNEKAKLKAFKKLEKDNVNALKAFFQLGEMKMAEDGVRMRFWKEYGPWYDARN